MAAELAALLAFSAVTNNDRVGLVLFTDQVEHFVPPKRGRKHVLRIVSQILAFKPKSRRTDIGAALTFLRRALHRRAIAFVISDFLQPAVGMQQPARRPSIPPVPSAAGLSKAVSTSPRPPEPPPPMLGSGYGMPLLLAARRHDVVPLIVSDPMEEALPKAGLIRRRGPGDGRDGLRRHRQLGGARQLRRRLPRAAAGPRAALCAAGGRLRRAVGRGRLREAAGGLLSRAGAEDGSVIALGLIAALATAAPHAAKTKPAARSPGVAIHQAGQAGKPTVSAKGPAAAPAGAPSTTSSGDWSGPEAAAARASKDEVRLGEPFEVTVDIKHAPGEQWSLDAGQKLDPFALIAQSSTVSAQGKLEVTHLTLKLALFKLDQNAVPEMKLVARDRAGQAHQLSLPGPTVKGIAPDLGKDKEKRDIHAPVPVLVPNYRLLWLALGILAALALAIWGFLWWRRRPERARAIPAAPPIPADEEALTSLAALEAEGLPARGELKDFHLRLSIIFRMYLSRSLRLPGARHDVFRAARRAGPPLHRRPAAWPTSPGSAARGISRSSPRASPAPTIAKRRCLLVRQAVQKTRLRPANGPAAPAGAVA